MSRDSAPPALILRGSVTGSNRAELIAAAKQIGLSYFALEETPECIAVVLRNEQSATTLLGDDRVVAVMFEADFSVQEHHDIEQGTYGPGTCTDCGKKHWPHSQLPMARWTREDMP